VEESIQKKRKGRKSQFLFTAQLLGKWIYSEIFSESKYILSLTKNKKELRQAPIVHHYVLS